MAAPGDAYPDDPHKAYEALAKAATDTTHSDAGKAAVASRARTDGLHAALGHGVKQKKKGKKGGRRSRKQRKSRKASRRSHRR